MDSPPTFSGTKTSDTVIDLKAATGDETTDSSRKSSETKESVADGNVPYSGEAGEKKSKPPPLDVSAAQELDQSQGGPRTPTSALPNMLLDRRKSKERKIGHRRVNQEGEITFKKIQTSQIMGSIQLGIGNAVGSLASKPERDLLMQDFTIVETTNFPKDGSNITPAHHYSEFRFKSYAPVAFRYFRDLFGIQPDDFLLSLCNFPLIELTNPGASGSIFYLTEDDEFIIKTVSHTESEFLMKLLPGYYMNLNQNPRTLLPKFFGLYCYQCGGKNVRLVVMNNLLPSFVQLHEKYDLKGSTYKRKASKHERKKKSPTYKDLDFMERHPDGIILEADTYNSLIKTITRDCRVLESFRIMDFSLLVGIYNLDQAKREKLEQRRRDEEASTEKVSDDSESASPTQVGSGKGTSLVRSKSINRQRLAAFSTAMESIQAEIEMPEEDEDVPTGGIPAKNVKGENLLLFLGVIDILQSFCLRKKLEHTLKSVLHDGDTVSVHRPGFYAHRFMDFMSKTVFRKAPSTGQHRKFKTMVTSVLALKNSPSKKKAISNKKVEADVSKPFLSKISSEDDDSVAEAGSCGTSGCSSSQKVCDPIPARMGHRSTKTPTVTWDKGDVISLSQVTITTESTGDCVSETSSSSGFSSTLQTVTWTPPLSVEGSTPTHTEGTPSFTESSSSGDAACPTTPVKCIPKSAPLGETQVLPDSEVTRL